MGVSWFEAVAFCRWLSEKLRLDILLPSEAEWERAARGPKGRLYPWGDEADLARRCNMDETRIGHTSAVGLFSNGDTPCAAGNEKGAADLAGNVWEWCRTPWLSDYKDYEKKVSDDLEGNSARVLRGASWRNADPANLRCSYRGNPHPGHRVNYIGFRVVCVGASAR